MIRPGSTSLGNQPGDTPPLPSQQGIQNKSDVYEPGRENSNSDVREGEEEVPAPKDDEDLADKLSSTDQAELHNVSVKEMHKANHSGNADGRPSAD